jgi:diaphanous 1
VRPPEALVKQLDVYTEDKFEDEEDMRERAQRLAHSGHARDASDSDLAFEELVRLSRQDTELHERVTHLLSSCITVLNLEMSP